jgi:hypothetical protein
VASRAEEAPPPDARAPAAPVPDPLLAPARLIAPARIAAFSMLGFALAYAVVIRLAEASFYGPPAGALEVNLYLHYARNVFDGQVPYRDFAFEYPPLALVPILLPAALVGGHITEPGYRLLFQVVHGAMGLGLIAATLASLAALGRPRRDQVLAGGLFAFLPLLIGPIIVARYDLWPALLVAVATWGLAARRDTVAAVAIGLGIVAKVYPVVALPFVLVYLARRDGGNAGIPSVLHWLSIVGLVVLAGVGVFFGVAPDGVLAAVTRAFQRDLQVESIGASLIFVLHLVAGVRVSTFNDSESLNLASGFSAAAGSVQTIVLAALLVVAFAAFARHRTTLERLLLAVAAALVAYVAVGRVLSPQYLLWLVGPVALIAGVGARAGAARRGVLPLLLLGLALALTGLYYPRSYSGYYVEREALWIGVVVARNLALVALAIVLLLRLWSEPPGRAAPGGAAPDRESRARGTRGPAPA